jgi:hypothetical protein
MTEVVTETAGLDGYPRKDRENHDVTKNVDRLNQPSGAAS